MPRHAHAHEHAHGLHRPHDLPHESKYDDIHPSPPLGVLAVIFVALFLASILAYSAMTDGASYPTPYRSIDDLQDHYERYPDAARVSSFFLFGASIVLGLFTATVVSRLRFHRVHAAGTHIALFGGFGASFFLALCALATWTLSQPGVAGDVGSMRVAQLLSFASGGVAHTALLGLLLAGVSVPSLFLGLLPRWACWFGLIVAGIAELSTLSLLERGLSFLLPLARFPALAWLLVAGFQMPSSRHTAARLREERRHGRGHPLPA